GKTSYSSSPSCRTRFEADPGRYLHPVEGAGTPPTGQAIDPVCGMSVEPATAAGSAEYEGHTYYFCSTHCLHKFQADPQKYVGGAASTATAEAAPAGTESPCPIPPEVRENHPAACPLCGMALEPVGRAVPATKVEYTCPMHPQIVQDHPGSCPICGMTLEPRTVTVEEGPNPELTYVSRRFWIGLVLTLPIFVLAMADLIPGNPFHAINPRVLNWVQLVLATPVVFWCGWLFFERAWASVVHRSPNMFTLMALGVGAASLYSLAATLAPGLFPEGFRTDGAVMPYFDTAAVVTVLVLLGQMLEVRARTQTSGAIRRLLGLAPR